MEPRPGDQKYGTGMDVLNREPLKANAGLGSAVVASNSEENNCDRCRGDYGIGNYVLYSCWIEWHKNN